MMESKPSKSTPTSTTAKQDPILHPPNTALGKKLDATPTLSTPKPAPTSVVHQYVTDAAEMISSTPLTRRLFLTEVTKMCLERAKQQKEAKAEAQENQGGPSTSAIRLPQNVSYSNYNHGQITPPEKNIMDRQIDHYAIPHTSTSTSGSTNTVTVSSNSGDPATPNIISNHHAEWKKTTSIRSENYNTSGSVMKKRVEQGLPNQVSTLFAPVSMAEDLTKVQLILCSEVKTELQEVKESITAIPFVEIQRNVTEATTMLEERMNNLEDQYNELKELIIHRTTQNYITDPTLLDHWNPADIVIKYSP